MRKIINPVVIMTLMIGLLSANVLLAADKKTAPETEKAKYRKVTGEVVSMTASSIVIKSRTKGNVSLAITNKTDLSAAKAIKPGDRARVNYRDDRSGKTATRVEKLDSNKAPAQNAAGQGTKKTGANPTTKIGC